MFPGKGLRSAKNGSFYKEDKKLHVLAGMFANAKSSVPTINSTIQVNQIQGLSSKHPYLSKAYSASPNKASKFSKFTRDTYPQRWDSVNNPLKRNEKTFRLPSPERINSDEEFPKKNERLTMTTHYKPILPWLKKWSSDEGTCSSDPHETVKFENPPGFVKTVDRFSSRLDSIGVLPSLSLQENSDTTLGRVEKTLMAAALAQTKDSDSKTSLLLYDLLVERSDWLLDREDLNDRSECLPRDPFYSHDVVTSDFEEYEQDKEAESDPSYIHKLGSGKKLPVAESPNLDGPSLDFLNETEDLESQEDFFNLNVPSCSEKKSKFLQRTDDHYPSFSQFSAYRTPVNRVERKRKSTINYSSKDCSSSSTKRHVSDSLKDTLPASVITADFSPFDFSLLSGSSPASPKQKKQPLSKFSIW